VISPEELKALCARIIQSGELGRSRTYAAILEYLAGHAIAGTTPKEVAIAMDVLGRSADFDVGKDSIVRVHIYHLRNKLNAYYARHGKNEAWRIDIPKGQYMLACTPNDEVQAEPGPQKSITGKVLNRPSATPFLAVVAIVLLALNLWQGMEAESAADAPAVNPFASSMIWADLLDDDQPVLVLVGDYYIMGQTDPAGNVTRMVREFDLNSPRDLQNAKSLGRYDDYMNLDLSYVPTGITSALVQVMKVFGDDSDRVKVKLMSQLNTTDLVGNHIIYLGYLSGMASLTDLMFADSGLAFGYTYDELINLDDDTLYESSSGLSAGGNYRDYGMLSTFPAPTGTRYVLLAGMRDQGLVNVVQEVTSKADVDAGLGFDKGTDVKAFEALFEVLGFDNTNFDANLVYSHPLDTNVVWETRLMGSN
jgi:hypothetical protein